mmetsp:Transcript_32806/g.32029  ORF Transcript_32806/g.32029 Transcript_32806/m.32029 type:complete len:113 (+) Transcript_32806:447-785(+)|eukprot:CAMPEP_0170557606 /NCGR_PEP_ID=MMETSP0211-20121228/28243_1 /TAXON_ID=311385 /ORGANISM="Pseudokeronopsis sp., Strain OXSARD2" /LENGTH=112 /DNA_ID=CAMNT_0010868787 /DNA_START=381 /DNA_END=719 /DNA_ORIENTATION=-
MISVLYVKKIGPTSDGILGPLTVALTIFAVGNIGGPYSGGSANPAVSISMIAFHSFIAIPGERTYVEYLLAYLIGEALAAGAAGLYMIFVVLPSKSYRYEQQQQDVSDNAIV